MNTNVHVVNIDTRDYKLSHRGPQLFCLNIRNATVRVGEKDDGREKKREIETEKNIKATTVIPRR